MMPTPKPYRLEIVFNWLIKGVIIVVPVIIVIAFIIAIAGYQDAASELFGWSFCLFFLLGVAIILTGPKAIKLGQKRRDNYALLLFNEAMAGNIETFSVFLRPFYTTQKIAEYVQTQVYIGSNWVYQTQAYELEQTIVAALDELMPVIALGKPGEAIGVGRILADENSWRSAAAKLMDYASLIICIPSARPGSEWELTEIIQRGYLTKTVFIMPSDSSPLWFKWKMMRDDWTLVARHMQDRGIAIPDYQKAGLLFSFKPDGGYVTERYYLPAPKTLRNAITKLSKYAAGPLVPSGETIVKTENA